MLVTSSRSVVARRRCGNWSGQDILSCQVSHENGLKSCLVVYRNLFRYLLVFPMRWEMLKIYDW